MQKEQTQPQKQIREPVKWLAIDAKGEIEINPEANLGTTSHQAIHIKIANLTIEVKPGFEPEHLLNIVKTLSKQC